MRKYLWVCLLFLILGCSKKPSPRDALERLMAGNQRFVAGKSQHPNRSQERRNETTGKQNPFAVIVGCSDSRVPPTIIFDQGLADLFVIRVAGNVVGPIEMESIQYAVTALSPSIVLVMGHQNCGAVDAVMQDQDDGIPIISKLITPAVKGATSLENGVKMNAMHVKDYLSKQVDVPVRAAYYSLDSGVVEVL